MQSGTDTIPCPTCGAPVPQGNRFCGQCGQPVAITLANDPTIAPAPYPGPGSPPGLPPTVPIAAPTLMQPPGAAPSGGAFPPGFAPPGMPPLAAPPRKRRWLARPAGRLTLLAVLVVLIAGAVAGYFLIPGLLRHGLPNDIPLPDGASFLSYAKQTNGPAIDQTWMYSVANTSVQQIASFYEAQLPRLNWQNVGGVVDPGGSFADIFATKGGNALEELDIHAAREANGTITLILALGTAPSNALLGHLSSSRISASARAGAAHWRSLQPRVYSPGVASQRRMMSPCSW